MLDHSTILRQWTTLRMIPRYAQKTTARQIQQTLADQDYLVSKRTIERDLQALSRVFPLACDEREKPFGWSWQKDAASFDLPGLTSTEALSLKLVEQQLSVLLPASVVSELAPYFKAASQRLDRLRPQSRAAAWPNKIRVVPPAQPLVPPSIKPEVQRAIYEALLQDRQIETRYGKRGEIEPIKYTLQPLAIVQRGAVTYLLATVANYADVRLFALHRFQTAEMLDAPVVRPKGFDLDKYIATGAFGFGTGNEIKLEAAFTQGAAAHLYETPLSQDQLLKPLDKDRIKISATVFDTPQLRWWLLGFGGEVEVVKPNSLRREIAEATRAAARRYE